MSLFGAMNTAISGLTAQSAAFTNIGDNVANSQTVGFKRVDTSFEDLLTQSNATVNQSGAVVARPDYANSVQGTVTQTDKPLDLAIAGQGFFTVSSQAGENKGVPVFNALPKYTREGDFALNKDNYLVNRSGNFLNGWPVDASGMADQTTLKPIQISQAGSSPEATSEVTLAANLPATPASTAPITSQVQVYDAVGQVANVNFGTAGNPAAPQGTIGSITAASGAVTGSTYAAGSAAKINLTADLGSGAQAIDLNLGNFGQANGLTQFAGSTYNLRSLTQNGVAPGAYTGVKTQANGDVVVSYDNGQSRTVARVPVTTFTNPDALQRQDGQAFTATKESGMAQTLAAGSNGAGGLVVSSVESSNVDIGKEFTKLIVAQRAYSANTKIVTTADELLQQTLDLKR